MSTTLDSALQVILMSTNLDSALQVIPQSVKDLLEECWQDEPSLRPDFHELIEQLQKTALEMKPQMIKKMMMEEPGREKEGCGCILQ